MSDLPPLDNIIADYGLDQLVKEISIIEAAPAAAPATLRFFADGYPGVVYLQTELGLLLPREKRMSPLFLYGQMIEPYELSIQTPYSMIAFQLYPFAARLLFNVDTVQLNDDCTDLSMVHSKSMENPLQKLDDDIPILEKTKMMAQFLAALANENGIEDYQQIQEAIQIIQQHGGLIGVQELASHLHTTERTLHRKFTRLVGVSPKKFAKITQFQSSLDQMTTGHYAKLTDIVYDNGYADQSHFIRNIKQFTGKKPLQFKREA